MKVKKQLTLFFSIISGLILLIINPITVSHNYGIGNTLTVEVYSLSLIFTILFSIVLFIYSLALYHLKIGSERFPNIVINISISITSVIVILTFLELGIRIISPKEPKQIYSYNKYFKMRWTKPNLDENFITDEFNISFKTNSIGLRDTRELSIKDTNEIRIMNLGDSFIQAAQLDLENTMTYILEKKLNSINDRNNIRFFNVGTSGCDTNYQRRFLELNMNKFDLDFIFLFTYIGNDIISLKAIGRKFEKPSTA